MKSLEGKQFILLWTVLTGSARTNLMEEKGPIEAPGGNPASRKLLEKPFVLSMKHEVSRTHHLLPGVIREGRQQRRMIFILDKRSILLQLFSIHIFCAGLFWLEKYISDSETFSERSSWPCSLEGRKQLNIDF